MKSYQKINVVDQMRKVEILCIHIFKHYIEMYIHVR